MEKIIDNKNWTYSFQRDWKVIHTWKWGDKYVAPKVDKWTVIQNTKQNVVTRPWNSIISQSTPAKEVTPFKTNLFDFSTLQTPATAPVGKVAPAPTPFRPVQSPAIQNPMLPTTSPTQAFVKPTQPVQRPQSTLFIPKASASEQWKLSVDEFAQKIKDKYPDYKDIDNQVLAEKMVTKYPDYINSIDWGTPTQPQEAPQWWLVSKLWQRALDVWQWFKDIADTSTYSPYDIASPLNWLAKKAVNIAWPIAWWINDIIWAWIEWVMWTEVWKKWLELGKQVIGKSYPVQATKFIYNQLPKEVKDTVKQKAVESIQWWVEQWNKFKQSNPQDARFIENTVNVASLFPTWKVVQKAWKWVSLISKWVQNLWTWKSIVKWWLSKAEKQTLDILTPKTFTPTEREALIKAWKLQTWKGITWTKEVFVPWKEEINIAKSASPYIKSNASVSENVKNLTNAIENEAKTLESKLLAKNPVIPKKEINAHIKNVTNEIMDNPEMVWENKKIWEKLIAKYKAFLDEEWWTWLWALKARKRFDNYVNSFKKWVFNPSTDSVYKTAVRAVRNWANDMVEKYAKDIWVKASLKTQSNLYKAIDMIAWNKDINILWKIFKSPYTKIGAWIIWWQTAYWLIK